jgi:hypothetical protein
MYWEEGVGYTYMAIKVIIESITIEGKQKKKD